MPPTTAHGRLEQRGRPRAAEKAAAAARLDEAYTAWDKAIGVIDEARASR